MKRERVICIPGWAHGSGVFANFAEVAGTACDVRVFSLVELAQRGTSETESCSRFASGLLSIVKAVDSPVSLVGWSLGAMVAIEVASLEPARVKKLVLLAGTPRFGDAENGAADPALRVLLQKIRSSRNDVLRDFYSACLPGISPERLARKLEDAKSWSNDLLEEGLLYLRDRELVTRIPNITAPTLLLHGDQDQIIAPDAMLRFKQLLPDALAREISGAPHALPETLSEEELAGVVDFLRN